MRRLPFAHLLPVGEAAQNPSSITDVSDDWPGLDRIIETLTFQAGYNTSLVIAGTTLLGLAAGIIGVFALLRKRSLTTDALSHATLPGIAMAFIAASVLGIEARSLPVLLIGASMTGVLGLLCIQAILRWTRLHEDAAIGTVLSVFFGAGVVGLSYIQANFPRGSAGINSFIYGQAATMQPADVWFVACIAALAMAVTVLMLKEFALVCFNDAFARVDGWPVTIIDIVMMALVVVVTVAGLQIVGLILVVALLIIPAAAARFWTERLWLLVIIAAIIGALSGFLGSSTSALLPRKPAGAVIVLTAGSLFAISMFIAPARGVIASVIRRLRLRLRIAGDHLLELAHGLQTTSLSRQAIAQLAAERGWGAPFTWFVLWWLRATGLISRGENGTISITQQGIARGARVNRNHALWEQYLISHADIARNHVDWSVDQVEHVLSDRLVAQLESELAAKGISVPAAEAMHP